MPTDPPRPPRARRPSLTRRRAVAVALVAAALALVASLDVLHGALLRVLAAAEPLVAEHPVEGAAAFVLWSALSAMLAFVSSGVLVPVAVYAWGEGVTLALLCLGWVLGGIAAYGVGRYLGRPVVGALAPAGTLARYEGWLSRRSSFGLVVLFQLALPSELPGYVLGLVRYGFGKFVAALALAQLPFAVGTVYASTGLIERRVPLLLALGAVAVLAVGVSFVAFRRRLRAEQARLRAAGPAADEPGSRP